MSNSAPSAKRNLESSGLGKIVIIAVASLILLAILIVAMIGTGLFKTEPLIQLILALITVASSAVILICWLRKGKRADYRTVTMADVRDDFKQSRTGLIFAIPVALVGVDGKWLSLSGGLMAAAFVILSVLFPMIRPRKVLNSVTASSTKES